MEAKVLIIDDNVGSLELMRAILEAEGYSVLTAKNGEDGLQRARRDRPALIIMDMLLPDKSGLEVCHSLKADPQLEHIPIIILSTAPIEEHEVEQMRKMGVAEHLSKTDALLADSSGRLLLQHVSQVLGAQPQLKADHSPAQKILVVDDDPGSRFLLRTRLEAEGLEVVEAADGEQGLAELQQCSPALILLDIQMPRMSGIEVLEKIKKDYPDTAVVMITAYGTEEIAVEAMRKGADDYISKPIDFRKLNRTIRNVIKNRQLKLTQKRLSNQLRQTSVELMKKVDELKKTNRSLIETQDRLVKAERLAAITQTAIAVNHQINNPLTVILGNAQLLITKYGEKDEKLVRALKIIENQCLRIRDVTHKLADLAEPILTEYVKGESMLSIEESKGRRFK